MEEINLGLLTFLIAVRFAVAFIDSLISSGGLILIPALLFYRTSPPRSP